MSLQAVKGTIKGAKSSDLKRANTLQCGKYEFRTFDFAESEVNGSTFRTLNGYSWNQLAQCGLSRMVEFKDGKDGVDYTAKPCVLVISKIEIVTRHNSAGEPYDGRVFTAEVKEL